MASTQLPLLPPKTEKQWYKELVPLVVETAHAQLRNVPTSAKKVLRESAMPRADRWYIIESALIRKARCRIQDQNRKAKKAAAV